MQRPRQQQEQQCLLPWQQLKLMTALPTEPIQDMPALAEQLQGIRELTALAEAACSSTSASG
jgi:hypothetical protein